MLWNWNTIDSCFLASSWHIRSRSMFAGSCIGVICLVIALEFLRRVAREYDAFIIQRATLKSQFLLSSSPLPAQSASSSTADDAVHKAPAVAATRSPACAPAAPRVRPTLIEQLIRAILHMLQFAVAYIIMLLAMYFNGYIIICIFIGAFLGSFIFSWEYLSTGGKENDATAVTKCCG
ncbi:Ctr copper transporter [Aspergillus karnatakaensis]|uniref:high-affinity Cu transporter CTR3 n=1 Tax=Aspergillus karnatakaensis TaxID=1810916 RepID=UPI003CCE0332